MSIKAKRGVMENLRMGVKMTDAMHKKAQEMIDLMCIVKADALKRRNQYRKMVKAGEAGQFKEVKRLFAEMQTWKKYDIKL